MRDEKMHEANVTTVSLPNEPIWGQKKSDGSSV